MQTDLIAPTIFIRNLTLAYSKQILFDKINLTLASKQCTCLLGPSGAGKSTLLKVIANLISNKKAFIKGEITTNSSAPLQQQIAYMAQTDLLLPWLNALDNTLIGSRLRGEVTPQIIAKARQLFTETGLIGVEKKYPRELSGGMRQRIALIRTLLEEKPIVLMDEPFSAVDMITRFKLQTIAANLLKERTVLLISHDPLEALRLANDIFILSGHPATPCLVAQLKSPTPRPINDPEVTYYQPILFNALMQLKDTPA